MEREHHQQHEIEEEEDEEPTLSSSQLLQLSETHLRLRNFSLSLQYALESVFPHDPYRRSNHRRAAQLAAVSDILLAATSTNPNWYSVLQVDTFSNDHHLIRSHFNNLRHLLDPIKDHPPFTNQAFDFLYKAFSSLSNPNSKSQLDSQLALLLSSHKSSDSGVGEGYFWTFCPYCFYVYQYDRVYEGCCLRCQNESCRRAFHGVSLCSLPKMELDKGQYFSSFGYFPLGFSGSDSQSKGGFGSWSPFVGLHTVKRVGKCGGGDFVEVSVDSDVSESEGDTNVDKKKGGWNMMGRGKGVNGGEGQPGSDEDEVTHFENVDDDDVAGVSGGGFDDEDVNFVEKGGEIYVGLGDDAAL